MTEFEPISALIGGLLIGLAASLLLLVTGRIAGISGILGRALVRSRARSLGESYSSWVFRWGRASPV